MSRILLDQNAPRGLCDALSGHDISTAYSLGWEALSNGDLLDAAESAGFGAMLTCDQNMRYQQNMSERQIALVVLSTNNWNILRDHVALIAAAVGRAGTGTYETVVFPLPAKRGKRGWRGVRRPS